MSRIKSEEDGIAEVVFCRVLGSFLSPDVAWLIGFSLMRLLAGTARPTLALSLSLSLSLSLFIEAGQPTSHL